MRLHPKGGCFYKQDHAAEEGDAKKIDQTLWPVRQLHESLAFFLNYPLSFLEWNEGCSEVAYADDLVRILWGLLKHTTLCLGYRFEEHLRPGKFKPEAAKALGVPYGPPWGKLKREEAVTL